MADAGDLTFEWSNEEGPDGSPGFYIQWGGGEDGSYVASSSAGAVDEESDESLWIRISLEPWEGAKTYSTLTGAEPTVLFDWTSAGEDDEGNFVDQSTFFLESSEGGSCETTVAPECSAINGVRSREPSLITTTSALGTAACTPATTRARLSSSL